MNYNTRSRRAILEYIKENDDKSFTVNEIAHYLSKSDININVTTIYRYLDKLTNDGTVIKHTVYSGKISAYQYAKGSGCRNHLHIQCEKCGKTAHIDCEFMSSIKGHILSHHSFSLDCNKSRLYGLCDICRRKQEGAM